MKTNDEINWERYSTKSFLETCTFFYYELDNKVEKFIDNEIDLIELEIKKIDKKKDNENDEYIVHGYEEDIESFIETITTLAGLKIINLFSILEIHFKKLLKSVFHEDFDTKSAYKSSYLEEFLKNKKIDISKFKSYKNYCELRDLNNHFKHSETSIVSNKINNIMEFKKKKLIHYKDINKFYLRIKQTPKWFINETCDVIYNELFVYNHEKLNLMAEKIVLKLEQKDSESLIELIKKKY